jgi:hypothetical protein
MALATAMNNILTHARTKKVSVGTVQLKFRRLRSASSKQNVPAHILVSWRSKNLWKLIMVLPPPSCKALTGFFYTLTNSTDIKFGPKRQYGQQNYHRIRNRKTSQILTSLDFLASFVAGRAGQRVGQIWKRVYNIKLVPLNNKLMFQPFIRRSKYK